MHWNRFEFIHIECRFMHSVHFWRQSIGLAHVNSIDNAFKKKIVNKNWRVCDNSHAQKSISEKWNSILICATFAELYCYPIINSIYGQRLVGAAAETFAIDQKRCAARRSTGTGIIAAEAERQRCDINAPITVKPTRSNKPIDLHRVFASSNVMCGEGKYFCIFAP